VDIVVKGRRCEVSDRFRAHVADKLARLEKFDQRVIRIDVEVTSESNPRLADSHERIELTVRSKGPVIRAEAAAQDRYAALDLATERLEGRMRRAAERRNSLRRHRVGVGQSSLASVGARPGTEGGAAAAPGEAEAPVAAIAGVSTEDEAAVEDRPFVVREKTHHAEPMSLDDALYQMELVGHDFYLFVDQESRLPSVVYRRRGYDYGVIRLAV
jgi:ribosomal subunit interface protein